VILEKFFYSHKHKCHTYTLQDFFLIMKKKLIIKWFGISRNDTFMCVPKHCAFVFVTMEEECLCDSNKGKVNADFGVWQDDNIIVFFFLGNNVI